MVRTPRAARPWLAAGAAALAIGSLALGAFAAEIYPKKKKTSGEGGEATGGQIVAVLKEVLEQQQGLLDAIEEIRQELDVVKVRSAVIPSCNSCCS